MAINYYRLKYIDDKMAEIKGNDKDEKILTEYVIVLAAILFIVSLFISLAMRLKYCLYIKCQRG